MTGKVAGAAWDGFYLPPLRRLSRDDFSNISAKKRLGEYRCLLLEMEGRVKNADAALFQEMEGSYAKIPTATSDAMLQKSWDLCKGIVTENLQKCRKGATKRSSQVSFGTAVWHRMGGSNNKKRKASDESSAGSGGDCGVGDCGGGGGGGDAGGGGG